MTVRIWEGRTSTEHSEAYADIIEKRDIPSYQKTEGFVKLSFLKRSDGQFTYFKLLTYWTGLEAIERFTGPNLQEAKFYDEDRAYLLDFPGSVNHYEVFTE